MTLHENALRAIRKTARAPPNERATNARRRAQIAEWRRWYPHLRCRIGSDPELYARIAWPCATEEGHRLRRRALELYEQLSAPPTLAQLEELQVVLDELALTR